MTPNTFLGEREKSVPPLQFGLIIPTDPWVFRNLWSSQNPKKNQEGCCAWKIRLVRYPWDGALLQEQAVSAEVQTIERSKIKDAENVNIDVESKWGNLKGLMRLRDFFLHCAHQIRTSDRKPTLSFCRPQEEKYSHDERERHHLRQPKQVC